MKRNRKLACRLMLIVRTTLEVTFLGFPDGARGKESGCQCQRHKRLGFSPWVRKVARKRKWQSTPVFLTGKCHGQKSLASYSHGTAKSQIRLSD